MPYRLRHRKLSLLRFGMLLLLAFGMAMQPVLAALGEAHELTAHAASSHGHVVDHPASGDHGLLAADGQGGLDDPMHALLHLAHCCGHSAALMAVDPALPNIPWAGIQPREPAARSVAPSHAATPFRPPISA